MYSRRVIANYREVALESRARRDNENEVSLFANECKIFENINESLNNGSVCMFDTDQSSWLRGYLVGGRLWTPIRVLLQNINVHWWERVIGKGKRVPEFPSAPRSADCPNIRCSSVT